MTDQTATPKPTTATKAVFAGIIAACGSLGVALADSGLTAVEVVVAIGATATAVGTVYGVTNKPVG